MTWTAGWWSGARKVPLHIARLGGTIMPWSVVVHSTDMVPESWDGLLRLFASTPGRGNAATFAIGRTSEQGVVQWASINRNANHAGGTGHGVYMAGSNVYHPNMVSVGIEVHNAGGIHLVNEAWRWGESPGSGQPWMPAGKPIPAEDVEPDPIRPGRGWHKPTQYQLDVLDQLLSDLEQVLAPMPAGVISQARGREKAPAWAIPKTARHVGHVSLDPDNRSDPWPIIMAHINR